MGRNGLTIYLAGKMDGLSDSEMKKWRNLLKSELEKYSDIANYKTNVVSPCDYFNFNEQRYQNEQEIMKFDLSLVKNSDIVIVNTNGLNSSIGSIIEVYEAWKNDIPVIAYDENGDYRTIHPWLKCCITRADSCVIDICEYIKDFYMR
jgi:nucleoside 2-deoxyribosyltransferase|nr:MAG TPA: deoxyribosyltransferase [Bacteriophage sp.]